MVVSDSINSRPIVRTHEKACGKWEAAKKDAGNSDEWSCTPESEYCTALEQLNRIMAALVHQYGVDGVLTLCRDSMNSVSLGTGVVWWCTGGDPDILIRKRE